MTPEILAKILRIIAKTGEKVVVVDPGTGLPFVVMGFDGYEALITREKPVQAHQLKGLDQGSRVPLTGSAPPGMIDPDLAFLEETKASAKGDWGGDESED